jgi:hypothetical protein
MSEFQDEHAGKGGSYVIDADGKRVLQQRTGHVAPEEQQTKPSVPAQSKKNQREGSK